MIRRCQRPYVLPCTRRTLATPYHCNFNPLYLAAGFSSKQFLRVQQQGNGAVVAQADLHMRLEAAGLYVQTMSVQ